MTDPQQPIPSVIQSDDQLPQKDVAPVAQQPAQPNISSDQQISTPVVSAMVDDQSQIEADSRPGVANQVLSQVLLNDDTLAQQPQYGSGVGGKEQEFGSMEQGWELPAGMGAVETEPVPEISPEVEKYVSAIQQDPSQFTQEVVIAQDGMPNLQPHYVARPVIVLPLTKQEIEKGLKASPDQSIRWLSEWAKRIWDMFKGEVVYHDDSALKN